MVMNNMENLELRYLERGYFCFREKFFVFLFFFFFNFVGRRLLALCFTRSFTCER